MQTLEISSVPASHLKYISDVVNASIQSVDPENAIIDTVRMVDGKILQIGAYRYDLQTIKHIYVIGVGKGAQSMAKGLQRVLRYRIDSGLVIVKHLDDTPPDPGHTIDFHIGDHPVPGENSLESTRKLVQFASKFTTDDLVICVVTGGGSSLMTLPVAPVTLNDMQNLTQLLLACGATIQEMNTIRKHIDQVKGGGLARIVSPAQLITLILSDVIANPIDIIASGPTVADQSTFGDAIEILKHYGLWEDCPMTIRTHFMKGLSGEAAETVKDGDECLASSRHLIIGDNLRACKAARQKCIEMGINALILTTSLRGEARETAVFLSSILREIASTENPIQRPACIIAGGETTVTLQGRGKGGRNQELALAAVNELKGIKNIALVALATDGEDGPTDSAGAIVNGETYEHGLKLGLKPENFLKENNSYEYFLQTCSSIIIGPTGTNVNDITFLFAF